jgi:hypothetical protein
MTGAVGTNVIKDGNGAAIVGGVRMFDVSGTGAGPWVAMSVLSDLTGAAVDPTTSVGVQGPGAVGAAVVGGPVLIGGVDASGNAQMFSTGANATDASLSKGLFVANAVMDSTGKWWRQRADKSGNVFTVPVASAEGGATISRTNSAGSNNSTSLKASAGKVIFASGFNVAAYPVYLKFYNKATAPTPGSDVSVWVEGIAAGVRFDVQPPPGINFATGIAFAIVKGIAESDNTAVLANDCVVNIGYL